MGGESSDTSSTTESESNTINIKESKQSDSSQIKQTSVDKTEKKEEKRPCCVCKETRAARDLCYAEKGFEECYKEIQLHKECMAKEGFKI